LAKYFSAYEGDSPRTVLQKVEEKRRVCDRRVLYRPIRTHVGVGNASKCSRQILKPYLCMVGGRWASKIRSLIHAVAGVGTSLIRADRAEVFIRQNSAASIFHWSLSPV
jgi:hypothetical protein